MENDKYTNPLSEHDRDRLNHLRRYGRKGGYFWISQVTGKPTPMGVGERLEQQGTCSMLTKYEYQWWQFMESNEPTAQQVVGECNIMMQQGVTHAGTQWIVEDKRWKWSRVNTEQGDLKLNNNICAYFGRWLNEQLPRGFITNRVMGGERAYPSIPYTYEEALAAVSDRRVLHELEVDTGCEIMNVLKTNLGFTDDQLRDAPRIIQLALEEIES